MNHGPADPSPLICVISTENDEIDRNANVAEGFTESHELRAAAFQVRLDNEQIQITIGATLAPGTRAEKDHLGAWSCRSETATRLGNQSLVSHDLDRSRRSAGKLPALHSRPLLRFPYPSPSVARIGPCSAPQGNDLLVRDLALIFAEHR